ncbi:hypothetical protein CC80DRAFT_495597 [Byssothecium circinans]|uniref:Uncharacterized protein n=1 Tax=Byssothecium circinans TaxID=147558 RepID=A0A6A5TTN1_9PLEO|nr:hypothetical protein CC80DRAFT_495597 [Byssothecium circinans]
MKGADFGKAIGIDRPANVKDKIKKWQQELDADAGAESAGSPAPVTVAKPAPSSPKPPSTPKAKPVEEKPSPKPAHTPAKSIEVPPEQPKSAKKPPIHNKLDDEVHVATAPKKRVMSDSHWRNNKSPPKDGNKQTSPKLVPKAWVRPAARKIENPEPKVDTPPAQPKPKVTPRITPIAKKLGERTRSQRKRRPSRPASSGNEGRPTSSGVTSAKDAKDAKDAKSGDEEVATPKSLPPPAEKTELVRVRRRSRTQTSPRGSLSAEDVSHIEPTTTASRRKSETPLGEDPTNWITVEYEEPSVVEARKPDEMRERRRRSRRHEHSDVEQETSPKEPPSTGRRRSHRKSYQKDEEEPVRRSPEPVAPATPPPVFGSRLEAWLSTTPDPFVDTGSRRRRKSRESVSTLELPPKGDKSDMSASTDSLDKPVEEAPERSSERRRRRRRRSPPIKEEPKLDFENVPSLATPTDLSDAPTSGKDTDLTPTPALKRRGARRNQHSPTKDRSMSLPVRTLSEVDEDVASSAPSSSVDPGALELEKTPLRAPFEGPAMRRLFPSTGKRLSTIASVETFAKTQLAPLSEATGSEFSETILGQTDAQVLPSELGSQLETSTIVSRRSTRRRLASHADLISVLSMPKAGTRSIVSARSIRTNRSRLATATISDIMNELASDENKYMRELRTLVDGVIPVLLSCVLSKSDSAVAAGLFSPSASSDPSNVTKPIVDMGVSLERLKTLHKRVPKEDSDAFLSWAQSAQRVYSDYINSWRLGFQDVVVSLASADEDPFTPAKVVNGPSDGAPWDEGLPRNAEGYVVNGDGERVDVAYMLKRPLVRLKYLSKTIKGINHVKPSERAEKMSITFQELVAFARKRSNDEHARLEDEAAARIDPTRARDPRSLAPLAGVRIDPTRCVRARDHFDMHLYHSSGQEVNCRVEALLRDEASGADGDLLLCEVDNTGRWLLLPPIQRNRISARNGDKKGEIIVMIRGMHGDGTEWNEVMSLTIDDEQAGFDWVQMLGLNPIPPQIAELKRELSVKKTPRPTSSHASSSLVSAATGSTPPHKSRTPSPHQIEIPIGEQANATSSKRWSFTTSDTRSPPRTVSPITPPSSEALPSGKHSPPSPLDQSFVEKGSRTSSPRPRSHTEADLDRTPRSLNDAMLLAGSGSPTALKRTRAKRLAKNSSSPTASRPARQIVLDDPEEELKPARKPSRRHRTERPQSTTSSLLSQPSKGFSVWLPTASEVDYSDESEEDDLSIEGDHEPPSRPLVHRRASSVPTMDMPTIPRQRKSSQPTTPVKAEEPKEPEPPASAPPKIERNIDPIQEDMIAEEDAPPPVPPHRTPSPATPVTLKGSNTPIFTPTLSGLRVKRRSSSPLKHEYEPSTCTESSSESEPEVSEDEDSITSESSEDELEDDVPTPLMPINQPPRQFPKVSPPGSIYTLTNGTITPSQSASNTPYRTVPQGSGKASKAVASIMAWSDEAGQWKALHPNECSVVVTPGKISVFEITAAHSKPLLTDGDEIIPAEGRAPLIAVELTPLVPLRKSTGIDIEIRSPPTSESRIKTGNYIMLRSRNTGECDQLYTMINHSRINNPTYIALQNARGPYGQSSWAEVMDRQNAARPDGGASGGWFGGTLGRRSSYRKTSTRAASISAATESSVGTMNTALRSALGRFSFARNGRFNIKGSTLGSRSANSFDTGSSGSRSGLSTPTGLDAGRAAGAPVGITNSKCRLYERESLKKWRDMGAARLTIMLPDPSTPNTSMRQGKGSPGARDPSQEKRILVVGKSNDDILLDVTLSESCFERVARLGIAVSVWEDIVGEDGIAGRAALTGGVSGARARVFMIQMKNERECAYSYSLLGKMRY